MQQWPDRQVRTLPRLVQAPGDRHPAVTCGGCSFMVRGICIPVFAAGPRAPLLMHNRQQSEGFVAAQSHCHPGEDPTEPLAGVGRGRRLALNRSGRSWRRQSYDEIAMLCAAAPDSFGIYLTRPVCKTSTSRFSADKRPHKCHSFSTGFHRIPSHGGTTLLLARR